MPSIHFRDSIGSAVITSPAYTFANFVPGVEPIGDRQTALGTGAEFLFEFRADYVASLDLTHIPPLALADLMRLKRHLLTGGLITVFTDDAASRVYTCTLKPGTTPSWTLADRVNLEYTLTLELRHVAPVPLLCDYSAVMGPTTNLIVNGNGETGTVGAQSPNWTNNGAGQLFAIANDQAFFGTRSLKHTNTSALKTQEAKQGRPIVAGQTYLLSAWVRLNGASTDFARLALWAHTLFLTPKWSRNAISATQLGVRSTGALVDWTYCAGLFVAPGTATQFDPHLMTNSAGAAEAWFAGVRLEPVPAA